jgi:hypothetical protein
MCLPVGSSSIPVGTPAHQHTGCWWSPQYLGATFQTLELICRHWSNCDPTVLLLVFLRHSWRKSRRLRPVCSISISTAQSRLLPLYCSQVTSGSHQLWSSVELWKVGRRSCRIERRPPGRHTDRQTDSWVTRKCWSCYQTTCFTAVGIECFNITDVGFSKYVYSKIWGFHSDDYEECRLLGCDAVWLM